MKMILSSDPHGWNLSENLIVERNLAAGAAYELGYALGASRPLALAASPDACVFCRENFTLGGELYGGLGTAGNPTLAGTSHYAAAVVAWSLPSGMTLRLSPGFGLNRASHPFVLRWGISYEVENFGQVVRRWFQ